jgi:hypothetical protein
MRIAYLAPYKGPTVVERRPLLKSLSLSNTVKIELVAKLLHEASHEIEIFSEGEVVESQLAFFPAFYEPKRFHDDIPIYYSSVLPVRYCNGLWSSSSMLRQLKARHRQAPFDVLLMFNFKPPHIGCANWGVRKGMPVVLEYEDDSFVDVAGRTGRSGFVERYHRQARIDVLKRISGGIGVSPHLLSQMPNSIPKMLLRGVVGDDIRVASDEKKGAKKNWIVFSGTHVPSNGVAELIEAWGKVDLPDWELHITGRGQLTEKLEQMAANKRGIVFHGLVSREKLVELLCSARICINPHLVSDTPGNVFAFKLIEYLAAGGHCITTRMGALDPRLEAGITYMPDNSPATIAATLKAVIDSRRHERQARDEAYNQYGTGAVMRALDNLLQQITLATAAAS